MQHEPSSWPQPPSGQQQPLSSTGQSFLSFVWTGLLAPALPSWGPGIPSGPLWAKEGTGTAKKATEKPSYFSGSCWDRGSLSADLQSIEQREAALACSASHDRGRLLLLHEV